MGDFAIVSAFYYEPLKPNEDSDIEFEENSQNESTPDAEMLLHLDQ